MTQKTRITDPQKANALGMLWQNRDIFSLPGNKPTFTNKLMVSINIHQYPATITTLQWSKDPSYAAMYKRSYM
uniref:Uncharacterized protein n=1 Tax=Romanomermis culicivorax TaxID=13658 RepID=A0A915HXA1_ROMCU